MKHLKIDLPPKKLWVTLLHTVYRNLKSTLLGSFNKPEVFIQNRLTIRIRISFSKYIFSSKNEFYPAVLTK